MPSKINESVTIRLGPFGMDLVFSIYYLAAPLVLIELRANPIELGLVGSLASMVHMTMSNLTGALSDRLGRRLLLISAPLIFAVSCLLMTFLGQVGLILALSALNGLCLSLFWPPFQAWVADQRAGPTLARDIGIFNLSWTAANVAGPVISGFLYALYSRLPFFFGAALSIALFCLVRLSVEDAKPQQWDRASMAGRDAPSWQRNFLYASWIANFASWFMIANARYQFPKLARELNIPAHMIGLIMGCIGLSLFSGFFILRSSENWHFRKRYLFGAHLLSATGLLLISTVSMPALFALALFLVGLASSVSYYSSLYYAVHILTRKGRGAGVHESIVGSGALSGPILGGIAAHYFGLRAPYLVCLAVVGMAAIAEWTLLTRKSFERR